MKIENANILHFFFLILGKMYIRKIFRIILGCLENDIPFVRDIIFLSFVMTR